jgi:hypothetical protein
MTSDGTRVLAAYSDQIIRMFTFTPLFRQYHTYPTSLLDPYLSMSPDGNFLLAYDTTQMEIYKYNSASTLYTVIHSDTQIATDCTLGVISPDGVYSILVTNQGRSSTNTYINIYRKVGASYVFMSMVSFLPGAYQFLCMSSALPTTNIYNVILVYFDNPTCTV